MTGIETLKVSSVSVWELDAASKPIVGEDEAVPSCTISILSRYIPWSVWLKFAKDNLISRVLLLAKAIAFVRYVSNWFLEDSTVHPSAVPVDKLGIVVVGPQSPVPSKPKSTAAGAFVQSQMFLTHIKFW